MDDRGAVEQLAADRHGKAEHEDGGEVGGFAREAIELAPLAVEEAAPLDEVLGRIAADDLLRKAGNGDVGVPHLTRQRNQA